MYSQLLRAKEAATWSPAHSEKERQWSVNDLGFCKYGNYTVIWSLLCIIDLLAAFICKRDSNTVTAAFWEWALTQRQGCLASHVGQYMFRLVANIHLSNVGCLYWETLQWHARCHILRMSVKGASTIFCFASWVIYVLIGWRHPFIKCWQPLLPKTTATDSLPHSENEGQRRVNSFSCCIFGNRAIPLIFAFITELSTGVIGKNTVYQR